MSLLERAKAAPDRLRAGPTPASDEEIDLAVAYIHGELRARQVAVALNKTVGAVNSWCNMVLRAAARNGRITILRAAT